MNEKIKTHFWHFFPLFPPFELKSETSQKETEKSEDDIENFIQQTYTRHRGYETKQRLSF